MDMTKCTKEATVYLGLGSNLGNLSRNIEQACLLIEEKAGHIEARSADFVSEPWGFKSDNLFLNIVLRIKSSLIPLDLLHVLQTIEQQMGRTEKSVGGVYHDRVIDIDILEYEGVEMQTEELTLPHPLIQERDFVYIPLAEVKTENK